MYRDCKLCTRVLEYKTNWFDRQPGAYTSLRRAPLELWRRPAGGEVRGPTSVAVTTEGAGTAAVETGMAPPVEGVQKTSLRLKKKVPELLLGGT